MRIKCPDCGQNFKVGPNFLGKTVECGSCDARFKVTTEDIVAEKKRFYPGEKKDSNLDGFGKKIKEASADVSFEPANYQQDVDAVQIGPLRPRRLLAIIAGISLMLMVALVFLFGGGRDGPMRDMENSNRFVLCAFAAVIGGTLLLYGLYHNKRMGALLAATFAIILMLMPVFFPANPIGKSSVPIELSDGNNGDGVVSGSRARDDYMFEVGYDPVEDAIANYPRESVVGIFLRNAGPFVRVGILRYLHNSTGRVSRGTDFKRGEDNEHGLILLVEQQKSIDEIAILCKKFGRINSVDKNLRLIDVVVESAKLAQLDKAKALDPESLDYEVENLKILQGIDPGEQMSAVKRLANSEPRALRADITGQLVKMLPGSAADMQLEIINALKTWAMPDSGAGPAVLDTVKKLHTQGKVSKVCMEFLVSNEVEGCEPILMELWDANPVVWSSVMVQLGGGAEVLLLPGLMEMDAAHIAAASDILGKVGTKACVQHLEGLISEVDEQKKKSLQAAIDEIKKRS